MEEFDPNEYRLLVQNPRISYRDLASGLGVSTPVIHKRLQRRFKSGSLFTSTAISTNYLNATLVTVFGSTKTVKPLESILKELGRNDRVCYATICSANMMIVTGLLERSAEMEPFLKFVAETCKMKNPTFAIESFGRVGDLAPFKPIPSDAKLSELDLRIISSLHLDARKSYGKVAEEVGISSKTAKKHIEQMIDEGSIEFLVLGNPSALRCTATILHINTKDGIDTNVVGMDIMRRFPDEVFFFRRYTNLPNLISMSAFHKKTSELNALIDELANDKRIDSIVPYIVVRGMFFETWREKKLPNINKRMDKIDRQSSDI